MFTLNDELKKELSQKADEIKIRNALSNGGEIESNFVLKLISQEDDLEGWFALGEELDNGDWELFGYVFPYEWNFYTVSELNKFFDFEIDITYDGTETFGIGV